MKKIQLIFLSLAFGLPGLKCQVSLENSYTVASASGLTNLYLTKLNSGGYKYVLDDHAAKTIKIYNTNHSLASTIIVPLTNTAITNYNVYALSDNLFDLNNDIEYLVSVPSVLTPSVPTPVITYPKVYVFKDNGSQVFFKDSASVGGGFTFNEIFLNPSPVIYNGLGAKLKLYRFTTNTNTATKWDIYSLPGVIPCVQCSTTGTTVGKAEQIPGFEITDPVFYPNPAADLVKLKYELPGDFKSASIKIQDVQGKLVEEMLIDNTFDHVLLPASYNSGLYFYSLLIDGKVIKTEKIIINK